MFYIRIAMLFISVSALAAATSHPLVVWMQPTPTRVPPFFSPPSTSTHFAWRPKQTMIRSSCRYYCLAGWLALQWSHAVMVIMAISGPCGWMDRWVGGGWVKGWIYTECSGRRTLWIDKSRCDVTELRSSGMRPWKGPREGIFYFQAAQFSWVRASVVCCGQNKRNGIIKDV